MRRWTAGQALARAAGALDVDRFKAVHASLGDPGADSILTSWAAACGAWTSRHNFSASAATVSLSSLPSRGASRRPSAMRWSEPAASPIAWKAATCSRRAAWARQAARSEDPFALIKNAELALIAAKRQGGACARLYSTELEAGPRRQRGAGKRASPCADRGSAGCVLPAHNPALRPQRSRVRGAVTLAASRQGPGRAGRFHRPFGRDRFYRGIGPAGAGTRRHRSCPLAALFPPEAAPVRQRQFLAPPAEGYGVRDVAQGRAVGQRHRAGHAQSGNHRKRHRR